MPKVPILKLDYDAGGGENNFGKFNLICQLEKWCCLHVVLEWKAGTTYASSAVEENNFDAALSYEIGHDLLLKNTLIIMKVQIINI